MAATVNLTAEAVLETLMRVIEPGYGINVVDLGLIYGVEVDAGDARITMTLPEDGYSSREVLLHEIEHTIRRRHAGVRYMLIDLVWDPPWREDFITAEGELQLLAPIRLDQREGAPTSEAIENSLRLVIDPELGINVVDLGLIYNVEVSGTAATVTMTLTTPGCPLHASIESAIDRVLETRHPSLTSIDVDLVWDPPWDTGMITPEGRAQLMRR